MTKTIFAMLLGLLASPVSAQSSIKLWQDLTVGMSKKQVSSLYPSGKVSLTAQCEAKVSGQYRKGLLVGVWLKFGGELISGKNEWNQKLECKKTVEASLAARYGKPYGVRRNVFNGTEVGDRFTWLNDPITIELYTRDMEPFTIITYNYTPPPESPKPIDPAAADKL